MKFKTEQDFKAEELYNIAEGKSHAYLSELINKLACCNIDSDDALEDSISVATKMIYTKCLLDAIHSLDFSLDEINQAIKIVSNYSFDAIIKLLSDFGVSSNVKDVGTWFKLVLHTTIWYDDNKKQ